MNGKFEGYWEEKNKVKVDNVWYDLASIIKPEYVKPIKKGEEVSFSLEKDNDKCITFIKKGSGFSGNSSSGGFKKPYKPFQPTYNKEKQAEISSQWAINCALEQIKAHNQYCIASGKTEDLLPVTDTKIQAIAQTKLAMRDQLVPSKDEVEVEY